MAIAFVVPVRLDRHAPLVQAARPRPQRPPELGL
jgi:hypothetical protein